MDVSNHLLNDAQDPRAMQFNALTLDGQPLKINAPSAPLTISGDGTINLASATPQDKIVSGGDVLAERGKQWGDAYKQISGDWDELLGIETTTEEFIAMMIVLKLRRWRNSGYTEKDCLTDIIGYAKLALN